MPSNSKVHRAMVTTWEASDLANWSPMVNQWEVNLGHHNVLHNQCYIDSRGPIFATHGNGCMLHAP